MNSFWTDFRCKTETKRSDPGFTEFLGADAGYPSLPEDTHSKCTVISGV